MGHSAVAMAAVIGLPHEKWEERPLLIIKPVADATVTKDEILQFLSGKVAKWWLPDDVVFVDDLPLTATGKISKRTLRDQFRGFSGG